MGADQIERIDQLAAPPVLGRFYLVPAILWRWGGRNDPKWWPVIGPKHDDRQFFNFKHQHYHVDARFLSKGHVDQLCSISDEGKLAEIFRRPLNNEAAFPDGPPPPHLRRMKCSRSVVEYPFHGYEQIVAINRHWAGQQCARSKFGWICPHRNVQLGSIAPIDGVITCPLHGMRIDAASGVVIPVTESAP